jgi:NAD+ synthase (glutamine-hydrolysing)
MRLGLVQLNATIGDFAGNLAAIRAAVARARSAGAELVLLPELATCGYPPLDLLERDRFVVECERSIEALREDSRGGPAIVVGSVVRAPERLPRPIANAAVVLADGAVAHVQHKTLLPTYDVFDEARYFAPARERALFEFRGRRIGLAICEDLWSGAFWGDQRKYLADPVAELTRAGADLILALSASPWEQRRCCATRRSATACRSRSRTWSAETTS